MYINFYIIVFKKIDDSEKFCWYFKVVKISSQDSIYSLLYWVWSSVKTTGALPYPVICFLLVPWTITIPGFFTIRQGCVNGSDVSHFQAKKTVESWCATSIFPLNLSWKPWKSHAKLIVSQDEGRFDSWVTTWRTAPSGSHRTLGE